MGVGKLIGQLREEKGIPVKALVNERLSRSTYNYTIANDTDMYTSNFFYLLDQLHVSVDEFMYIQNGYQENYQRQFYRALQRSLATPGVERLLELKSEYVIMAEADEKYTHFVWLCDIQLQWRGEPTADTKAKEKLQGYFNQVTAWSRYELLLFNNSMNVLDLDYIEAVLKRVIANFKRYDKMHPYANDVVKLLGNTVLVFLTQNRIVFAKQMFMVLREISIEEQQAFERLFFKFVEAMYYYKMNQQDKAEQLLERLWPTMDFLEMSTYKNMFNLIMQGIVNKSL